MKYKFLALVAIVLMTTGMDAAPRTSCVKKLDECIRKASIFNMKYLDSNSWPSIFYNREVKTVCSKMVSDLLSVIDWRTWPGCPSDMPEQCQYGDYHAQRVSKVINDLLDVCLLWKQIDGDSRGVFGAGQRERCKKKLEQCTVKAESFVSKHLEEDGSWAESHVFSNPETNTFCSKVMSDQFYVHNWKNWPGCPSDMPKECPHGDDNLSRQVLRSIDRLEIVCSTWDAKASDLQEGVQIKDATTATQKPTRATWTTRQPTKTTTITQQPAQATNQQPTQATNQQPTQATNQQPTQATIQQPAQTCVSKQEEFNTNTLTKGIHTCIANFESGRRLWESYECEDHVKSSWDHNLASLTETFHNCLGKETHGLIAKVVHKMSHLRGKLKCNEFENFESFSTPDDACADVFRVCTAPLRDFVKKPYTVNRNVDKEYLCNQAEQEVYSCVARAPRSCDLKRASVLSGFEEVNKLSPKLKSYCRTRAAFHGSRTEGRAKRSLPASSEPKSKTESFSMTMIKNCIRSFEFEAQARGILQGKGGITSCDYPGTVNGLVDLDLVVERFNWCTVKASRHLFTEVTGALMKLNP